MIQNNDTDWLRKLGERVDSIEDVPAEGAFEAIMASAAGARRRARARRTVALVAGLAAAAAVSTLFLLPEGAVDAPQNEGCLMAENTVAAVVEAAEATRPVEATAPEASEEPTAATEVSPAADPARPEVSAAAAPSSAQPSAVTSEPETRPDLQNDLQNAPQNAPQTVTADNAASLERYIASLDDEKPRRRRFSIAVNSGSASVKNDEFANLMVIMIPTGTSQSEDNVSDRVRSAAGTNSSEASVPNMKMIMVNRSQSIPVIAGVTLSYDLSDRYAIESGINYFMMVLRETPSAGSSRQTNYHYLGIPLALKADIFDFGKSDIYLKAGGMAETCVGASKPDVSRPEGLFWSASGSAGYQYRLAECLGVYLEPGFSYHFNNSEGYRILPDQSSCPFTLQAGLRFIL